MPQKQTSEEQANVTWERSAWVAKDVSLAEPKRYSGEPMQLANDEHVIDVLLDGESIRRV
jgi:hypothetical protein